MEDPISYHCFFSPLSFQAARPILELLAEEAARPFEAGEAGEAGNLVESPAGHMMLKKVIAHDANRDKDCRFSGFVLSSLDDVSLECWIRTNRGSFLLADMISDKDPESAKAVKDKVNLVLQLSAVKVTPWGTDKSVTVADCHSNSCHSNRRPVCYGPIRFMVNGSPDNGSVQLLVQVLVSAFVVLSK